MKGKHAELMANAMNDTVINAAFVEEIDLGAFKQKTNLGDPVRKAVYDMMIEMYDGVKN